MEHDSLVIVKPVTLKIYEVEIVTGGSPLFDSLVLVYNIN